MASLERQLTELGKRLAPRSTWADGVRQTILTRGHARRSYFGMGRFVFHMPVLFPRFSSTLGAVFMMILGLTASVSAAKESLPGHRLYGLKRTIERVELKATSSENKPQLQITQATRRLREAGVLAVTTPNSPKIKESLDEFRSQIASTASQIDNVTITSAQKEAIAQTIVNESATYSKVLEATKVVVAPPLQREARQAKHLVNLSTVKAVETLVDAQTAATVSGAVTLNPALQASIKDQVAALKLDTKEATALVQLGSTKRADVADAKVRVDLAAKAAETIGTAEYLVEKGDYIQATAKVRQTLEFMVKLDAEPVSVAPEATGATSEPKADGGLPATQLPPPTTVPPPIVP